MVDRRTVLAGAAWSVPVVGIAVAAPAAAASEGTCGLLSIVPNPVLIEFGSEDVNATVVLTGGDPNALVHVAVSPGFMIYSFGFPIIEGDVNLTGGSLELIIQPDDETFVSGTLTVTLTSAGCTGVTAQAPLILIT